MSESSDTAASETGAVGEEETVPEIIEERCDHENSNLEENVKTQELNRDKDTEEVGHQKKDDHEATTHTNINSETGSVDENDDAKVSASNQTLTATTEQKSVDESNESRLSGKED